MKALSFEIYHQGSVKVSPNLSQLVVSSNGHLTEAQSHFKCNFYHSVNELKLSPADLDRGLL